jgi:hypothetical protein
MPKGTDDLVPVFEIDAVGPPFVADQLARHRGDLPAFAVSMRCRRQVSSVIAPR